jgi:hypothetical protein
MNDLMKRLKISIGHASASNVRDCCSELQKLRECSKVAHFQVLHGADVPS